MVSISPDLDLLARVFAHDCPPPVENDAPKTVTAPAASGRVAGTSTSSVALSQKGLPSSVPPASAVPALIVPPTSVVVSSSGLRTTLSPIGISPQKSLLGISPQRVSELPSSSSRLSNLDLNGHLVKRGLYVSHGGMRYLVTRVNRGHFYAHRVGFFAPPFVSERMRCESVQVVA